MDSLIKDLRYGFRSLAKHPGFTALAVIILALSIAATTAIFSVVNSVLLRPLGFPEPERLMVITEVNPQQGPEPFEDDGQRHRGTDQDGHHRPATGHQHLKHVRSLRATGNAARTQARRTVRS